MSDSKNNYKDYEEALDLEEKLASNAVSQRVSRLQNREEQVVNTLWGFMESVFKRVDEEHSFKQEVRDELRARISEMDVGMLMAFYNRLNDHETDSLRTAMMPFMPKEGKGESSGRTLVDTIKEGEQSAETQIHDQATPEDLNAVAELNNLLQRMQKTKEDLES